MTVSRSLAQLNPLSIRPDHERAYAMFLPAVNYPYARHARRDFRGSERSLPEILKGSPAPLDFLDPTNAVASYPYVLASAGQFLGKSNLPFVENIPSGAFLLSDSGGFQIAKGTWKPNWSDDQDWQGMSERVLRWQESISHAAIPLDVPTEAALLGHVPSFEHCLEYTMRHHEYFSCHRDPSANVTYLNVLQGDNEPEREAWFNTVRNVEYTNGWAISFRAFERDFIVILRWLVRLAYEGELDDCRHIHFLGVGHLKAAVAFTVIQRAIRRHYAFRDLIVSYDCSTPFKLGGKQGVMIGALKRSKSGVVLEQIKRIDDPKWINSSEPFPYLSSPIGQQLTYGHLCVRERENTSWDPLSYVLIMAHNFYAYTHAVMQLNRLYDLSINNPNIYSLGRPYHYLTEIVDRAFGADTATAAFKILRDNESIVKFFSGSSTKDADEGPHLNGDFEVHALAEEGTNTNDDLRDREIERRAA